MSLFVYEDSEKTTCKHCGDPAIAHVYAFEADVGVDTTSASVCFEGGSNAYIHVRDSTERENE